MLKSEFDNLFQNLTSISINDLSNLQEHTLLVGETQEGDVFHVYLRDNKLNRVIYNERTAVTSDYQLVSGEMLNPMQVVPLKGKVFPNLCDPDFCRQLAIRSVYIPFEECPVFDADEDHRYTSFHAKTHYTLGPPADSDVISMAEAGRVFLKTLSGGNVYLQNNNTDELEVWFTSKHTTASMSKEPRIRYKNTILNFSRVEKLPAPSSYNKA